MSTASDSSDGPASTTQVSLLGILVAIVGAAAMKIASGVLVPLVLSVFLVYLLVPIMGWFKRHRVPEALTLPATLALLVGFVVVLQLFLAQTVTEIGDRAPYYSRRFEQLLDNTLRGLGGNARLLHEVDWVAKVTGALSDTTVGLFGGAISFVGNLVLVTAYTIFFIVGRKSFARNLARAFPDDRAAEIRDAFAQVNQQVQRYITAKIVLSAFTGGLMYAVLLIFGVDFAVFFGLMGFMLNFIPTIGSAIAAILPILVALVQFDSWLTVAGVAVCLIAIQNIIGNGIEPRVLGDRLNLSPIVVIFGLVFFGWLWGFVGMVLSVPMMATIKIAMSHSKGLKPIATMMEN